MRRGPSLRIRRSALRLAEGYRLFAFDSRDSLGSLRISCSWEFSRQQLPRPPIALFSMPAKQSKQTAHRDRDSAVENTVVRAGEGRKWKRKR